MKSQIARNLFLINDKIQKACKLYRQDVSRVNLIAVSKTISAEKICEAIDVGCKIFGENYIKETKEKWPEIKNKFPEIKLHFIGHLQSNKAAEAVELFDCIQTLDSQKLALALKKEVLKQKKDPQKIEFFIQVNIGEEVQKGGVNPSEVEELVKFSRNECGLNVTGLMCIPPSGEVVAPYFALLAKMSKENNLKNISMGMSSDFEEAIALGATHIRLGTAIFGERQISS
jgi:PLP dependent protein